MFTVIQSNDTQILAKHLSALYQKPLAKGGSIFDPFLVIVPAMVLDEWLKKTIAKHATISTLITTQFWGQYQWQLIDKVLKYDIRSNPTQAGQEALSVPDTAVLSQSVIRWRIFAYLMTPVQGVSYDKSSHLSYGASTQNAHAGNGRIQTLVGQILADKNHPLHETLSALIMQDDDKTLSDETVWRFCDTLARLYVQYLTERTDWLHTWAMGGRLDVPAMIAKKDALSQTLNHPEWQAPSKADDDYVTPAWLFEHYVALERALAFLWQTLFAQVFLYRERLEMRFWELLANKTHPNYANIYQTLPKTIHLFTVQQLPQTELNFLKKLSSYTDVVLLHFNPSAMFWADIVDKNWLTTQRIIRPHAVYLKDYGHGLLSRLGKASRETFAMLADMAGGEHSPDFVVDWQDDFNEFDKRLDGQGKLSLLTALKKDIAMLEEEDFGGGLGDFWQTLENKTKPQTQFYLTKQDDSLLVHNCHSIKRELEIARAWIGRWLNEPNADGTSRKLSDVAIMLPDVESHKELLLVMFSKTVGLDGLVLPATITGVQDKALHELWTAIFGLFSLTAGRFYYQEFCEWLFNPYVHETFGMDMTMAVRASDLLKEAGFVRGLHEQHLQETLDKHDRDYRACFAYALDRLVVSLSMRDVTSVLYPFTWQADTTPQKTATLLNVHLEDEPIIHGLCRIYQAFIAGFGVYEAYRPLQEWLIWLEHHVINRYFYHYQGEEVMRGIFNVMNGLKSSVRANFYYTKFGQSPITHELKLPLKFVLETIATAIQTQKISAETSDVIQIGRFGSLRGISFGLVVMVCMNLSEFPRTEPINRLDLSKAGLPRRGDRVGEDDDSGAFLEAILQARENCWIFYSGQMHDGSERLPATPVGELLQFIKSSINDDTEQQMDKTPDHLPTNDTPAIFEHIVVKHPALPFERGLFEVKSTATVSAASILSPPPAPLWQAVYQESQKRLSKSAPIALPTHEELVAIHRQLVDGQWDNVYLAQKGHVDNHAAPIALTSLIADITKPNRAYLRGRMVRLVEYQEDKEEALVLSGLDDLRMGELVLQTQLANKSGQPLSDNLCRELARLPYEPTLPAGANKDLALQQLTHKADTLIEAFFVNQHHALKTSYLPTSTEQGLHKIPLVHSGQNVSILAKLPSPKEAIWQNIVPKRLTPTEQVSAFIYHVAWQLIRPPQDLDDKVAKKQQSVGASFWQFLPDSDNKKASFLHFAPMSYQTACLVFGRFLTFAKLLKCHPLALTPDNALHQLASKDPSIPAKATLDIWVAKPYGYVPNGSSFHDDWQVILADTDPMVALEACLPLIPVLYQELLDTLVVH